MNLSKEEGGFAFTIEEADHPICGSTPRVRWEDARVIDLSADDALIDQAPRAQAAVEKSAEVQSWLRDLLEHGAVPAQAMWRKAEERGHSERRVRAAIRAVGAACDCKGYQGQWHYWIPEPQAKGPSERVSDSGQL